MKVLVIGAAGFVGTHVMDALEQAGADPVGFDVRSPSSGGNSRAFAQGNMSNLDEVLGAIHDHDISRVVVLGYIMAPLNRPGFTDFLGAIRVNVAGVTNVFEACRLEAVDRVIFASTCGIYGSQADYGERPVTEDDPPTSSRLYGRMKILNETLARQYRTVHGADIVTVRPASILGAGNTMWPTRVLSPVALGQVGHAPFSRKSPNNLVSVDDLAWIYSAMTLASDVKFDTYLVTGHNFIAEDLLRISQKYLPEAVLDFDESAGSAPYSMHFDNTRVTEEFGWKLRSLEDAVLDHFNGVRIVSQMPPLEG